MLLWALSTSGRLGPRVVDAAAERMATHGLSTYDAQGLSMVAWALASSRAQPSEGRAGLLRGIEEAAALRLQDGTRIPMQAVATLLWAFATLGSGPSPHPCMLFHCPFRSPMLLWLALAAMPRRHPMTSSFPASLVFSSQIGPPFHSSYFP